MAEMIPIGMIAALPSPLPPPPSNDVLTAKQWTTLLSIADTFIPSITSTQHAEDHFDGLAISDAEYSTKTSMITSYRPVSTSQDIHADQIRNYLTERTSSIPNFKSSVHRTLGHNTPSDGLVALRKILTLLDTRVGSFILTGSTTSFHLQPFTHRTQILQNWSKSYFPPLSTLFRSLQALTKKTWLSLSPTLPQIIDFPSIPPHTIRNPIFEFAFLEPSGPPSALEPWTLSTDILIIGSGCGAGVCASNLASAGYRVLVVEKGYHFPSSHFPMQAEDAGVHLFENGGAILSDDGSTAVLAGSTWGGGGTVNWSASLQPQHFVRQEWAAEGLPLFTSQNFQESLDRVCKTMGVSTEHIEHNFSNECLLEGARRLGYAGKDVPQNTAGKGHLCGYCGSGCASATKQGPANRWLVDAKEEGAEFVEGCDVREITFEGKKAMGVKGVWTSKDRSFTREVVIKASRVIVSCGTLNSPLLLMRSGITNAQLGRNLHLHPTAFVGAVFDEETRPWEGGILTAAVTSLEDQDGKGHGPKIEMIASTPLFPLSYTPWTGALDFKMQCAKFHHMAGFIPIERDRDTGRVYPDPVDGKCRIEYTTSQFDLNNVLEGVLAAAKIAKVMGAKEIYTCHPDARRYTTLESDDLQKSEREGTEDQGVNEPAFQSWLDEMRKLGLRSPDPCTLGSAHQMGTCRMSSDSRKGVVDPTGRVWGTEGLYVADASVFPSASGVNPMVTTMGIADWISRGIAEESRKEQGQKDHMQLSAKL